MLRTINFFIPNKGLVASLLLCCYISIGSYRAVNMRISSSLYALFFRVIGLTCGFLSVLCISRWLSAEDAGLFFSIVTTLIAFSLFSRLGQDKSIIPEIVRSNQDDKILAKAFSMSLYPCIIFSLFWLSVFDICYMWLLLVLYLLVFNNIISSYFKAKFKPNLSILFENSFAYVIQLPLLVIFSYLEKQISVNEVLWFYALSVFIQFIFIIFLIQKIQLVKILNGIRFLAIKDFFYNFLKLKEFMIISYLGHLLRFIPIIIIMTFFSLQDLTSYKVIEQVAMSSGVIITALNSVYSAVFSKHHSNNVKLKQYVMQSTQLSFLLGVIFIVVVYYARDYILIFAKIDLIKYDKLYLIFLGASFLSIFSAPVYNALIMIGMVKYALKILVIALLFSILIMWLSIYSDSILTLASSQLFFYFFLSVCSFYYFLSRYKNKNFN